MDIAQFSNFKFLEYPYSIIVIIIFLFGLILGNLLAKLKHYPKIKQERKDAIKRSRAIIDGQISEQLAPYLPNFPCNPSEVRFIGKPVDYIAFSGSTKNNISEIVFIEVKTGRSNLSPVEKSLKEAIFNGKVRYAEYHID